MDYHAGAHVAADTAPRTRQVSTEGDVAADVDDGEAGGALDPMVAGERQRSGESGWYRRVEGAIAHLWVQLRVVEDDGGGRRRARSGGDLRVLSDDCSGDAPAMRRGSGGRGCDGGLGGVLHDNAAATTAAQFEDEEARSKTLNEELRRR